MKRLPLAAATIAGAVCLAAAGGAGAAAALLTIVGFVGGSRLRVVDDWTPVHVVVLAGCAVLFFALGVVPAFAVLLGWLAAHRAVVGSGREDERVLLLLGTLMALVGTVGTISLALAPALLTFAAAAPVAMLEAGGVRDRRLAVGTSVATLVLSIAFFVLVPRLQGGLMASEGKAGPEAGFADDVALGDESGDSDRSALVMRVRSFDRDGKALRSPQYLRGRAMDHFDGTRWTVSGEVHHRSEGSWEVRSEVLLEPLIGATVFGPPDILSATSPQGPIRTGADRELVHSSPGRRVSYEVFSRSLGLSSAVRESQPLLQLPALHPDVRALAATLAPGRSDAASIVAAATGALRDGFTYTLDPPAPTGDPLAWFLLESRTGHCEYYASALAVLLRSRGVPARLATGFYSSEYTPASDYLAVRRGHAHAWVEVPVAGGWVVVDATPSSALGVPEVSWFTLAGEVVNEAWLSLVLNYDLTTQFDLAGRVGAAFVSPTSGDPIRQSGRRSLMGVGVVLGGLMGSGVVLRAVLWWLARPRDERADRDRLVERFRAARARTIARGWRIPPELPPMAAGTWLVERAGPAGEPLRRLAELLYRSRYAGEAVPMEEVERTYRESTRIPSAPRGRVEGLNLET